MHISSKLNVTNFQQLALFVAMQKLFSEKFVMGLLLLVTPSLPLPPPLYGMRSYIMPCYWALQLGNLLYIIALVITYIIVYILGNLFFMLTTGKIMPWQGIKPRFAMAVSCMWVSMTNHSIVYKVSSSLLCACHCHWECIPGTYCSTTLCMLHWLTLDQSLLIQ